MTSGRFIRKGAVIIQVEKGLVYDLTAILLGNLLRSSSCVVPVDVKNSTDLLKSAGRADKITSPSRDSTSISFSDSTIGNNMRMSSAFSGTDSTFFTVEIIS